MAKQMGFYFDADICTNCKACEVACQDKNDLPQTLRWRRVYQYGGGNWIQQGNVMVPNGIFTYSMSIACMHCTEATCTQICPAGAMTKDANGLVQIDEKSCIGCRYCEWACPYGAPKFDEAKGVMTKCTGCADLVAQGQKPACVTACVMRALDFGDLDELRTKYGMGSTIAPLPSPDFTQPALVVHPHRHAQPFEGGAGRILNLPEEL